MFSFCVDHRRRVPLLLASLVTCRRGANYPNRAVKLIVPFGAGGPADVYARVLASICRRRPSSPSWSRSPGRRLDHRTDASPSRRRRLHAAGDVEHPHHQRVAAAEQAVQLMRDFVRWRPSIIPTCCWSCILRPGQIGEGVHRSAQKEKGKLNYASSGPARLSHGRRAVQSHEQDDIVHVPHKASGDMRIACFRQRADDVRRHHRHVATRQGGQGARARDLGSQAQPAHPRSADGGETVPGYASTIWIG